MADGKILYENYEDFQAEHPEYSPEWREFAESAILDEDDGVYGFIFGYLLI